MFFLIYYYSFLFAFQLSHWFVLAPVPEETHDYESDCSIAAAANQSLDLSRSLIDDLDNLVGSEDEKENDTQTKNVSKYMIY